ncbi:MAG: flagellar hook-basal body complex protein FliE [Oscillospiraceae bacterium]
MNTISPLQRIETLKELQAPDKSKLGSANEIPFKDVFSGAIKDVVDTDRQVTQDVEMLVSGQTDDLSGLMIDMNKAQLSVSLLVQMRNKALDSYNEIMRINL